MNCGLLCSPRITNAGSGLPCADGLGKWWHSSWATAVKPVAASYGSGSRKLTDVVAPLAISGTPTRKSLRRANISRSAKTVVRRIMWNVGTIPSGNTLHDSCERHCLFPRAIFIMSWFCACSLSDTISNASVKMLPLPKIYVFALSGLPMANCYRNHNQCARPVIAGTRVPHRHTAITSRHTGCCQ
jgi:hypothetical protein